jgi:hypothetical protein
MQEDSTSSVMAELTAAAAIQEEAAYPPVLFECGEITLRRLRRLWRRLDDDATLAYEDKVAAQVRALDEAIARLWHLHKALVATRR